MMSKVDFFLSVQDEKEVVEAILLAEKDTSGEIRVHIEKETSIAPFERAIEVFYELRMNETKASNGVLIYVATKDQKLAICGDKGINDVVPIDFWESTKSIVIEHFKRNEFKSGLVEGILKAGQELKKYFPYQNDDIDELSNEISKG